MLSEISLSSIKNSHQLREYEEKKSQERKKNILCLIAQYFRDEGYVNALSALKAEAQHINQYELCDNVDLPTIIHEYESYYYIRFQKYPKISKKMNEVETNCMKKTQRGKSKKIAQDISGQKDNNMMNTSEPCEPAEKSNPSDLGGITVVSLGKDRTSNMRVEKRETILKPLAGLGNRNQEWLAMAEIITKDIVLKDLNVYWTHILGLEEAKSLLKEAVVYPIKYPELFSGILSPWKGLLLFGPSGTGKTLLAKAVASECKTTFFNITSSSIISKWRGDSEKLVRVMFDLARYYAPSTIFIDEIDAIASNRDGCDIAREHEASRRLKAELLIHLDGLSLSEDQIFLLATSNLPWELDPALLRRLEKRILVGLPNVKAREAMFRHYLPEIVMKQPLLKCKVDYCVLANNTAGYSGSDIHLICKETAMQAVRKVFNVLDDSQAQNNLPKIELDPITTTNVMDAIKRTKPASSANINKYKQWYEKFGSV